MPQTSHLLSLLLAAASAASESGFESACGSTHGAHSGESHEWSLKKFSTLVTFGNSFSATGRSSYYFNSNGKAPPLGWSAPLGNAFGFEAHAWPTYVGWYSGARVYNYALNGAACSKDITPRYLSNLSGDYPDVHHEEIPAYEADNQYVEPNGTKSLMAPLGETVHSLWIGTNDLDLGGFLTDEQAPGTNLTTYVDCVFDQLQRLYASGARHFVLQNLIPLHLTPLLATPENGGVVSSPYWPQKPDNRTAISYKMLEMVVATNAIYKYRTPFEVVIARRCPGAQFALMDMYGLYLNGSAPANNTGFISHCGLDGNCTKDPSPDSFLWYDESHPSEQADRIIAKAFVDVVRGKSQWATYWSSNDGLSGASRYSNLSTGADVRDGRRLCESRCLA